MDAVDALERLIRRDRALLATGLAAMTVLAWAYLARSLAGMDAMAAEAHMHAAMGMASTHTWGLSDWVGLFVMWAVMMVAMMVPSAAPVMLLVLGIYRRQNDPRARTAAMAFVTGYLVVWGIFSLAASGAQVGLHRVALLTADMRLGSNALAGGVLIAAGAYQFLPWKSACLTHCQSPLGFLQRYWREGIGGGLSLGVRHGMFCVGCCWLVMALLFVVGVMDLVWVAVLAGFVLIEKLLRRGALVGRMAGVAAGVWGVSLLLT